MNQELPLEMDTDKLNCLINVARLLNLLEDSSDEYWTQIAIHGEQVNNEIIKAINLEKKPQEVCLIIFTFKNTEESPSYESSRHHAIITKDIIVDMSNLGAESNIIIDCSKHDKKVKEILNVNIQNSILTACNVFY